MRVTWLVTSAMLAALVVAPGYAQTAPELRVTVPFEFTIDNTAMPAGQYAITDGGVSGVSVLTMRSSDSQHTVLFSGSPARRSEVPDKSTLVFNRYGSKYFLTDISWAGSTSGLELRPSKAQKEIAKTASAPRPERVVLMASR